MKTELGSRFNSVTRTYTPAARTSFGTGFTPTSSSVLSLRDKYNSLSRTTPSSSSTRTEKSTPSQYDTKSSSDSRSKYSSSYKPYGSTSTYSDSTPSRTSSYSSYRPYSSGSNTSEAASKSVYTPWSKSYGSSEPEKTSSYRSRYSSKLDVETTPSTPERRSRYSSNMDVETTPSTPERRSRYSSNMDVETTPSTPERRSRYSSKLDVETKPSDPERTNSYRSSYYSSRSDTDSKPTYVASSSDIDTRTSYSKLKSDSETKPLNQGRESSYSSWKPATETKSSYDSPKTETVAATNTDSVSVYSRYGHYNTRKSPTPTEVEEDDDDMISVTTRYTSPTLPSNSVYLRNRRAELESIYQCEIRRKPRFFKTDQQCQYDENDFNATSRASSEEEEDTDSEEKPSRITLPQSYMSEVETKDPVILNSDVDSHLSREEIIPINESSFSQSTFRISNSNQNLPISQPPVSFPDSDGFKSSASILVVGSESTAVLNYSPPKSPSPCKSPGPVKIGSTIKTSSTEVSSEISQSPKASSPVRASSPDTSPRVNLMLRNFSPLPTSSPANSSSPNICASRSRSPTPSYNFTISPRNHRSPSNESISNKKVDFNVPRSENQDKSPSYHLSVPSAFQTNGESRQVNLPYRSSRSSSPVYPEEPTSLAQYNSHEESDSNRSENRVPQKLMKSTSSIFYNVGEVKHVSSFSFKFPDSSPDKSLGSDQEKPEAAIPKIYLEPASHVINQHVQSLAKHVSTSDSSSKEKNELPSESEDSLSFNGPKSSTTQTSPSSRGERADKPPIHPASPNVGVRVSSKERMDSIRYALMRSETPAMVLKSKSFESSSEDVSDLAYDFSGKHYVINEFTEQPYNIPNVSKNIDGYSVSDIKSTENEDLASKTGTNVESLSSHRVRKFDSGEKDWWAQEDSSTSVSKREGSRPDLSETQNHTSEDISFHEARSKSLTPEQHLQPSPYHIRKFDSGEKEWWYENEAKLGGKCFDDDQSGREWWLEDEAKNLEETIDNEQNEVDFWAELAAENEKHELELSEAYHLRNMGNMDTSSSWWIEKEISNNDRSQSAENLHYDNVSELIDENGNTVLYDEGTISLDENERETDPYAIRKFDSGETPWFAESPYEKECEEHLDRKQELDSPLEQNQVESGVWSLETYDSNSGPPGSNEQFLIKTVSGHTLWYASDRNDGPIEFQGEEQAFRIGEGEKMCWVDDNTISQSFTESTAERPWFADKDASEDQIHRKGYKIRKIESGERPWWLDDEEKTDTGFDDTLCSQYRATESHSENYWTRADSLQADMSSKASDGGDDVENMYHPTKRTPNPELFISNLTNIDELLGDEFLPMDAEVDERTLANNEDDLTASEGEDLLEVTADQVKIHDNSPQTYVIEPPKDIIKLDDAALQLYKDGDYSSYLDLDASITEQHEEFEGFQANRKNSIVLRTQLSVRVHTIIEKLLNSEGSELRRALFCLKQIFQEDKDLVHEFVQNDGLSCLIKVGSDANQNYQNYILRALGQVMLYVDGMNGVIEHNETIQWLYSLVSSKFRLVVKTALKLLLVFVEYVESNCLLLIQAISIVDKSRGTLPWSNIMKLLNEYDVTDTELLIYAMTLINKTLNRVPDLDTYYDQVDEIEKQGIKDIVQRYMTRPGTDLDFLHQLQTYEAVLNHEDGGDKSIPLKQLDDNIRTTRYRNSTSINDAERRRSRRHSTGTSPLSLSVAPYNKTNEDYHLKQAPDDGVGVTPALRRRLERGDRQKYLIPQDDSKPTVDSYSSDDGNIKNGLVKSDSSNGDIKYYNGDATSCLPRENTVKDLTQKLTTLSSPVDESPSKLSPSRMGEMKGIISKAIEGLAKSQSKSEVKSPTNESPPVRIPEVKKSETELHWEELLASTTKALQLCDLDFTDLGSEDEKNILAPTSVTNGIPPPPPPCAIPPPVPVAPLQSINKTKKTVKLFWKEVCEDPIVMAKMNSSLIWDELTPVNIDTQKLEHLFESRTKDLITKEKQHELNKNKEIIVLDPKRSNAINIGMTKLPPPRAIKTAILKMDATVMNREGIEKLLTMLPTDEERSKIQEAQTVNPELPLGSAEQFLLTLASITELAARLKLWAFKLDYENSEKEIAEPLMDLKQGMELLKTNKTFRAILATLLSIGIFLNGNEVKGFQIEYLAKVPEVKDTVHKHSLLHHLCHMVMGKFPQSTDLYSEIGAVTRASKVDFDELALSIRRMEQECKASFDHLKVIVKHDGTTAMKGKMSDFLADCAERIIVLGKVHRRVINRYHKFCLWLGIPLHRVTLTKPNELCRIISEFALEYRTTRERVLQQLEKKANHRERNKTRGKMITEIGKVQVHTKEDRADAELRQLLGHEPIDRPNSASPHHGSLPWRRQKKDIFGGKGGSNENRNGHFTDGDDELLETLVKTATKIPASRAAPRERKRIRNADRKSFIKRSRTRDNVQTPEQESSSPSP